MRCEESELKIVGKLGYKNRGFFSGIVGTIELNEYKHSKYVLVYNDGSMNCFNSLEEITLINGQNKSTQ